MNKNYSIPFFVGYLLLIAGAILHIFGSVRVGFYVFGVGVVCNLTFRFLLLPKSDDKRIRRLNKQQFFLAVLLIFTGYAMYAKYSAWIVPLLIFAIIELWLTFRYPKKIN
ncbi:MAG: hypothetical protein LBT04_04025 [Prevotellaceae bacterium]|jgi:hypothetical protein|nr:hypothetical protein [Prevotellaceae bacterium]